MPLLNKSDLTEEQNDIKEYILKQFEDYGSTREECPIEGFDYADEPKNNFNE